MPVPHLAGPSKSSGSGVELSLVSPDPPQEPLSAVVARFNVAIRKQDWASMRACCSDDAIIESVTANEALGPDETVAAVRAAYRAGVYHVQEWLNEDLTDDVVLSAGESSTGRRRAR